MEDAGANLNQGTLCLCPWLVHTPGEIWNGVKMSVLSGLATSEQEQPVLCASPSRAQGLITHPP